MCAQELIRNIQQEKGERDGKRSERLKGMGFIRRSSSIVIETEMFLIQKSYMKCNKYKCNVNCV